MLRLGEHKPFPEQDHQDPFTGNSPRFHDWSERQTHKNTEACPRSWGRTGQRSREKESNELNGGREGHGALVFPKVRPCREVEKPVPRHSSYMRGGLWGARRAGLPCHHARPALC